MWWAVAQAQPTSLGDTAGTVAAIGLLVVILTVRGWKRDDDRDL